ncbi:MAG TPA: nitrilase-related carbon-nitrogen hydrolase [Verrucomicrobiae bacterium]|nr:nitrilase-related carbon-nitrogen hydrolase [Verrucomicrobiae bacterium]
MAPPRLVVTCLQTAPRLGDLGANLAELADLIAQAVAGGAHLVITPELSCTGYFLRDLVPEVAVAVDGDELGQLARAAGDGLALVGAVVESSDHLFHNAAVLVGQGSVRVVHRKVYLPTYGLFDEQRYLAAGDRFEVVAIPGSGGSFWRVGLCICEDLWHPSAPWLLSLQRMDLLVCPSASPGRGVRAGLGGLGSATSYQAMTRTYAELLTCFVAHCNRVGYEDGVGFWGGSRVLGPDGEPVAGPLGADRGALTAVLERGHLRRARIAFPLLRDERVEVTRSGLDRLGARAGVPE